MQMREGSFVEHSAGVLQNNALAQPLPQLRTGDLSSSRVFHQVVHSHSALSRDPAGNVLQSSRDVHTCPLFGDASPWNLEREDVREGDAGCRDLVLLVHLPPPEVLLEQPHHHRHKIRVGHPGTVNAVLKFSGLVVHYLLEDLLSGLGILSVRDIRSHTANRVGAVQVAHLHEFGRVGLHEGHSHGDLRSVWQCGHRGSVPLDDREDVVPSAGVEADDEFSELEENLFHFESSSDGLDQNCHTGAPTGDADVGLAEGDHVRPEARFGSALQFGEVHAGPFALSDLSLCVEPHVHGAVEHGGAHGFPIHHDVLLVQVPAPGADQQSSHALRPEAHLLPVGTAEADGARGGVTNVHLSVGHVFPRGRRCVLEVGHEAGGPAVESADDLLSVDGSGDLHPSLLEVGGRLPHLPRSSADLRVLRGRGGEGSLVEEHLLLLSLNQEVLSSLVEVPMYRGKELKRILGQNLDCILGGPSDHMDGRNIGRKHFLLVSFCDRVAGNGTSCAEFRQAGG
mmetsp:Transcript_40861/g.80523  ORF Transcript_40861/g.80523 Transcript_40861/m.80523 type:complete len:510 (+) Transcript_40861:1575-3104(+)